MVVARIAAARQHREGPLNERVRQVHEHGILARTENGQRAELLNERLGPEREHPHRPLYAIGGLMPYRLVDHVTPAGEPRVIHGIEAGGFRYLVELRASARRRCEGGAERGTQRRRIEIDLGRKRLKQRAVHGAVFQIGGRIGIEERASLRGVEPPVQVGLHSGRVFALNQAAMHGAVEHFVGGAEIFADLVGLADHVSEKPYVLIDVAHEVIHGDIAGLAVAVEASVTLLQS